MQDVIEQVVTFYLNVKRAKVFGLDNDDIAQEIRLKCLLAYKKKKVKKKKAFPYLKKVSHNHLYNLQRGILYPNNPPCYRCPLRDVNKGQCVSLDEKEKCQKLNSYWRLLNAKRKLRKPLNYREEEIVAIGFSG